MVHFAHPRIRVRERRAGGRSSATHRRAISPREDLCDLIVRLAEESERGQLEGRNSPTGIFIPDEDDPWTTPADL